MRRLFEAEKAGLEQLRAHRPRLDGVRPTGAASSGASLVSITTMRFALLAGIAMVTDPPFVPTIESCP